MIPSSHKNNCPKAEMTRPVGMCRLTVPLAALLVLGLFGMWHHILSLLLSRPLKLRVVGTDGTDYFRLCIQGFRQR